jgi:hypothetical protein
MVFCYFRYLVAVGRERFAKVVYGHPIVSVGELWGGGNRNELRGGSPTPPAGLTWHLPHGSFVAAAYSGFACAEFGPSPFPFPSEGTIRADFFCLAF